MRKHPRAERADVEAAVAAADSKDSLLVRATGQISELADQPPLIAISVAVLAAGLVSKNGRMARAGARMLAAEIVATGLKSFVKNRIDRTRPQVVVEGGSYKAEPGDDPSHEMNSFPSGHTAGAVAVARAVVREYPEHKRVAYATAAAAGAVQVPRGAHYPSDVAAGALVGIVAEYLVDRVAHAIEASIRPPKVTVAEPCDV